MSGFRIAFLTNAGCGDSIGIVSGLARAGEDVSVYFSTARGPEAGKGALALVREYGLPFIARKAAAAVKRRVFPGGGARALADINAPVHFVADINGDEAVSLLESEAPDLLITSTFSQILSSRVIGIPKVGCINVHSSLLPMHRGPAPVFWALYERVDKTGATVHYIDADIDTGNILLQGEVPVERGDTIESLERKLAPVKERLTVEAVRLIKSGEAKGFAQPFKGKYYRRPNREDWLRFNEIMRDAARGA